MLPLLVIVLHVLTVLWLVSGIVGRDLCYGEAGRSDSLAALKMMVELGGRFERAMVRPATFIVLATGLVAARFRGWPILGVLQGGNVNWVLTALLVYLSVIPLIVFVFLPKGRVYHARLAEAETEGRVTPALRAALHDRALRMGRAYELVMIGVLVWLMVTKPF